MRAAETEERPGQSPSEGADSADVCSHAATLQGLLKRGQQDDRL
jgi:hypothetical protein